VTSTNLNSVLNGENDDEFDDDGSDHKRYMRNPGRYGKRAPL